MAGSNYGHRIILFFALKTTVFQRDENLKRSVCQKLFLAMKRRQRQPHNLPSCVRERIFNVDYVMVPDAPLLSTQHNQTD